MLGVHGAADSAAPSYVLAPPATPTHAIDRTATLDHLDRALAAHRVVLVVAPPGYGKTALLSAWHARCPRPVGWLSLTPFDRHPERLERGLVTALEPLLGSGAHDLSDLLERDLDDAVLIVDDIHLIGPGATAVLGVLLDRAPPGLRIVLASRRRPLLRLQRLNAEGGLGEVSPSELAFSADEVRLAAGRLGRPISDDQAARLVALTAGWPVAIRLALLSEQGQIARFATAGQLRLPSLTDYLLEEILADLPTVLRDFLLTASVCDWLTARLAIELSRDRMAPAMLDDLLSRGLPLERRDRVGGEAVYRWHPLLADQCRALLRRRDPALAEELHRRAARYLATSDPALAARHALSGRSPELATELVIDHWLSSVLHGDLAVLEELCVQLPAPWSEHPDILSIRATCRSSRDAPGADRLRRRAHLLAEHGDAVTRERHEVTELLSDLLVTDDRAELVRVCRRVRDVLTETSLLGGANRACVWFLVAFAEIRLRRTTAAVPALEEAIALARAEGLADIADRATANLVFALTFNGDFAAADRLLELSPGNDDARWRLTEGRPEWFAVAWMSFWRDDLEQAQQWFERCIASGGAMNPFATIARIWTASIAATTGDPALIRTAEASLEEVGETTVGGLPLHVYKGLVRAQIAIAGHQVETAETILDTILPDAVDVPTTLVFAAEAYLSCGEADAARRCLADLVHVDTLPGYIAVAAGVIDALIADHEGRTEEAHRLLENALGDAAPEDILRPFVRPDPRLGALLASHAEAGTVHAKLLAAVLARIEARSDRPQSAPAALTGREREVLAYLQTDLSQIEIADALFISVNTVKTHQRSIYQKLGVSNRREASRIARGQLRSVRAVDPSVPPGEPAVSRRRQP